MTEAGTGIYVELAWRQVDRRQLPLDIRKKCKFAQKDYVCAVTRTEGARGEEEDGGGPEEGISES